VEAAARDIMRKKRQTGMILLIKTKFHM